MLEFEGSFDSELNREELWEYFTDPDVLADCAPGLSEMTLDEPYEITATVSVGVGSVKPTFDVDATVTEATEPGTLRMRAGGDASRSAFETKAVMNLNENDGGGTTAEWSATVDVSGIIASMGKRGLGSVTDRLVNQFFEAIEETAASGEPAESRLEAVPDEEAADVDLDG
jgi:carbon monoxide dehydrogenase subunit G